MSITHLDPLLAVLRASAPGVKVEASRSVEADADEYRLTVPDLTQRRIITAVERLEAAGEDEAVERALWETLDHLRDLAIHALGLQEAIALARARPRGSPRGDRGRTRPDARHRPARRPARVRARRRARVRARAAGPRGGAAVKPPRLPNGWSWEIDRTSDVLMVEILDGEEPWPQVRAGRAIDTNSRVRLWVFFQGLRLEALTARPRAWVAGCWREFWHLTTNLVPILGGMLAEYAADLERERQERRAQDREFRARLAQERAVALDGRWDHRGRRLEER